MKPYLLAAMLAAFPLSAMSNAASAQTAEENFSYKAPSGMFSEGTTKWQTFQFLESDAEKTAKLRAGDTTGSTGLSTSSSNQESYPRTGRSSSDPRQPTGR